MDGTCLDCDAPLTGRQTRFCCRAHAKRYERRQSYRDVKPGERPCERDGCNRKHYARGLCSNHYRAERKQGAPNWANDYATFTQPRFQGERINDNDLGAYYKALAADPCVYCGGESVEVDHIHPRSLGGHNFWTNRAPVCKECNFRKGNRSVLMFMLAKPLIEEYVGLRDEIHLLGGLGGRCGAGGDPVLPSRSVAGVGFSQVSRVRAHG